jgi:hypothetical protein
MSRLEALKEPIPPSLVKDLEQHLLKLSSNMKLGMSDQEIGRLIGIQDTIRYIQTLISAQAAALAEGAAEQEREGLTPRDIP